MAIYLIDFENVHDSGLSGVTSLKENDEVCIFYSMKSEHMSFDTHVNIMKTSARVKYIKLRRSAKNYLDFQMVTHLGYLIGARFEGPYYIISKDTGYDSVIDYWKDHGITVTRQPCIGYNRVQGKPQNVFNTPPAKVTIQENSQVVAEDPNVKLNTQLTAPSVTALQMVTSGKKSEDRISADDRKPQTPSEKAEISEASDLQPEEAKESEAAGTVSEEQPVMPLPVSETEEPAQPAPAKEQSSSSRKNNRSRSRRGAKQPAAEPAAAVQVPEITPAEDMDEQDIPADLPEAAPSEPSAELPVKEETEEVPLPSEKEEEPQQEDQVPLKPDTLPESYRKKVRTALKGKGIPSANYASIYKAIVNSYDKLALNNLMVKTFGSSKGGIVYNLIKDVFTDYHANN